MIVDGDSFGGAAVQPTELREPIDLDRELVEPPGVEAFDGIAQALISWSPDAVSPPPLPPFPHASWTPPRSLASLPRAPSTSPSQRSWSQRSYAQSFQRAGGYGGYAGSTYAPHRETPDPHASSSSTDDSTDYAERVARRFPGRQMPGMPRRVGGRRGPPPLNLQNTTLREPPARPGAIYEDDERDTDTWLQDVDTDESDADTALPYGSSPLSTGATGTTFYPASTSSSEYGAASDDVEAGSVRSSIPSPLSSHFSSVIEHSRNTFGFWDGVPELRENTPPRSVSMGESTPRSSRKLHKSRYRRSRLLAANKFYLPPLFSADTPSSSMTTSGSRSVTPRRSVSSPPLTLMGSPQSQPWSLRQSMDVEPRLSHSQQSPLLQSTDTPPGMQSPITVSPDSTGIAMSPTATGTTPPLPTSTSPRSPLGASLMLCSTHRATDPLSDSKGKRVSPTRISPPKHNTFLSLFQKRPRKLPVDTGPTQHEQEWRANLFTQAVAQSLVPTAVEPPVTKPRKRTPRHAAGGHSQSPTGAGSAGKEHVRQRRRSHPATKAKGPKEPAPERVAVLYSRDLNSDSSQRRMIINDDLHFVWAPEVSMVTLEELSMVTLDEVTAHTDS